MKERLDVLMVQRQLAPSREKAKALIMAGCVLVDGEREDKAGTMFADKVEIGQYAEVRQPWRTETGKGNGEI